MSEIVRLETWTLGKILDRNGAHFFCTELSRRRFHIDARRGAGRSDIVPFQDLRQSIEANKFGENVEFNQFRASRWSSTHSRYHHTALYFPLHTHTRAAVLHRMECLVKLTQVDVVIVCVDVIYRAYL